MSDLAHADDIVILSGSYSEMRGLLEAVNRQAAAVGIQAVLLDGEQVVDVDKFKHLGSMLVANGQGTKEIRNRITLALSAFSLLHSCLWSRREISLRTRGRSTRQ